MEVGWIEWKIILYLFSNWAWARKGEEPSWRTFPRNGRPKGPGGSLVFFFFKTLYIKRNTRIPRQISVKNIANLFCWNSVVRLNDSHNSTIGPASIGISLGVILFIWVFFFAFYPIFYELWSVKIPKYTFFIFSIFLECPISNWENL